MQSANLKITGQWKQWLAICIVLLAGPLAFGGESGNGDGVKRSRVYSFKHITSEQARDLFSQLNLGQNYNTLSSDVLIITSTVGAELVAATEIVGVLDRAPLVQIRPLMAISENNPAPPLDEFFAALGTISAGTMTDAPPKMSDRPAIIDVFGDELVAIATEDVLTQIETAMDDWKKKHPVSAATAQKAPALSVASLPETPREESSALVVPDAVKTPQAVAAPNLPDLSGEPNDVADAVLEQTVSVETPAATEIQPSGEESLEAVARQILEARPTTDTDEPPAAMAETESQEESEDDFLSEGLLQELAAAERESVLAKEKARLEAAPQELAVEEQVTPEEPNDPMKVMQALTARVEAEERAAQENKALKDAAATEATPEKTEPNQTADEPEAAEKDPLEIMRALLAQSKADEERALAAQKEAIAQAEMKEPPTDSPLAGEAAALKNELALLHQKLAALEATAEETTVAETAAEAEKPKAAAAKSKVQTADSVQTEPQIDPKIAEEELDTVIDLPQEVELEALIDLVGKQLGLNYMYEPAHLKNQKVQLKLHGGKIKVKDTYALLESVLRFKGFIMTRRGQLVTILKAADAAKAEPVLRRADDPIQPGDIIVSSMFELEHIDAVSAQNMLKGMHLGTAFTPIAGTRTLVVTDFAYRMDRIQRVLDMIDVPGEEKEYKLRTLKYMKPSEIIPKLKDLTGQLQGISLQINAPVTAAKTRTVKTRDPRTGRTITKPIPITTSTPSASKKAPADAVFIDTDDRTNRILMAGKADQIELVNELIDVLDVPQYDLKMVREYIIENVEASEVIDVLNELALASVSVSAQKAPPTSTRPPVSSRNRPPQPRTPQPAASKGASGSEQPYISIRPATNSLLVNATEEQHKAIELIIAHVDVVQKDQRTIRQYEIQYVDTQEIIETLTDLEIIAPQTSRSDPYSHSRSDRDRLSRSNQATGRANQPKQTGAAAGAASLSLPTAAGGSEVDITADQPQISVLETTNSLLVYATPRQHDAIALVIAHADRQLDTSSTPYVVYALENQDPLELAEVLTKLIQETVEQVKKTSTPTSKIQSGGATTPTAKLPTLEEQNIRVIPDEMSYSLIVYANKRNQQWISELIKELDEYRPQVLLDCTLVEILKDDAFQYSLDIIAKTYGSSSIQSGSPVEATATYGDFSKRTLGDISSIGGDVTGFFNSQMIQGVLEAIQTNAYGRVMAQPKILVNDNQEGEIKTENITSIAQQKTYINPATGTSPESKSVDVSFSEYSEGVTLTIKPHISKGDMLRLEVTLKRTDFDDSVKDVTVAGETYPKPPDLISTDVKTVATVPDGTTIILGGLESVGQAKTQSKVPLLGDLPLIGTLFRGVDNIDRQRRLYVFVKANIIRPGDQAEGLEDIRRVSKKYRDEFEKMEEKFQDLQDFPGIKPPPMDPIKVLEEDFVIEENWPVG